MKLLLSPGPRWRGALVCSDPHRYGFLLTVGGSRTIPANYSGDIGVDNGCFSGFRGIEFSKLLSCAQKHRRLIRFVAAPDVVESGDATLALFDYWRGVIREQHQLPVALVLQAGITKRDIPWRLLDAVFVGGSTEWKLSGASADLIREAQRRGKWVHVGRVNTPCRITRFRELSVDSIDGTGFNIWSNRLHDYERWMRQELLFAKPNTANRF
ncbi:MAG: hypothetical protein ABI977_28330 [Acidobacteriota bacterium]